MKSNIIMHLWQFFILINQIYICNKYSLEVEKIKIFEFMVLYSNTFCEALYLYIKYDFLLFR